jgi:hypothetical protein
LGGFLTAKAFASLLHECAPPFQNVVDQVSCYMSLRLRGLRLEMSLPNPYSTIGVQRDQNPSQWQMQELCAGAPHNQPAPCLIAKDCNLSSIGTLMQLLLVAEIHGRHRVEGVDI